MKTVEDYKTDAHIIKYTQQVYKADKVIEQEVICQLS
jgi:hypothetical protein